jgi:hypothetical protein
MISYRVSSSRYVWVERQKMDLEGVMRDEMGIEEAERRVMMLEVSRG